VTGASSGIGASFAHELARRGAGLVLTARRKDRLDALAKELTAAHGVPVAVIPADLGERDAARKLFDETVRAGHSVDILINNAGFGTQERFDRIPWEKSAEQIQLNIVSLTELTRLFVSPMLERGRGHILNVASTGAFMPVPFYATYAAGKAYVLSFSLAVASELSHTPVRVCCLCPGGTATEFLDVAGQRAGGLIRATLMSSDRCARIGLRALFAGRRSIVSGIANTLMCWSTRLVPERLVTWVAGLVMGKRG